jgi:hypothetical protein
MFHFAPAPGAERADGSDRSPAGRARAALLLVTMVGLALALLPLFARVTRAGSDRPVLNQGPMIHLDERRWDLGVLPQEAEATHTIRISNAGTAPLRILQVQPDCGCTAAVPHDSTLAPGESSSIEIKYSSEHYEGFQQKIITLKTNDPAEPRIDLVFTVEVKPYIAVDRRQLDFGTVQRSGLAVLTSRFSTEIEGTFKVGIPNGGEKWVNWKVTPASAEKGTAYVVEARLRSDAPFGFFNERIEVPVTHPKKIPYERIFVKGCVYSYFQMDEPRIDFPTMKSGQSGSRVFKLHADGSKPFRITGATTDASYLSPTLEERGNEVILKVKLAGVKGPKRAEPVIILTTTDPAQPEIRVPVRVRVAP